MLLTVCVIVLKAGSWSLIPQSDLCRQIRGVESMGALVLTFQKGMVFAAGYSPDCSPQDSLSLSEIKPQEQQTRLRSIRAQNSCWRSGGRCITAQMKDKFTVQNGKLPLKRQQSKRSAETEWSKGSEPGISGIRAGRCKAQKYKTVNVWKNGVSIPPSDIISKCQVPWQCDIASNLYDNEETAKQWSLQNRKWHEN